MSDCIPGIAAEITGPCKIRLRDASARLPESGEVLLLIQHAGVCGTDIALYHGHYPVPLPLVPGHEFSAVVEAAGAEVQAEWVGKRVVCEINNTCVAYGRNDICEACRRGMVNHCLTRTVTGIINHPGAFATNLTAPAGCLHELPDSLSDEVAIFVEPLAAAIRTFELTPITQGDWVLVLGAGRLGRLVALVANKMGARVITVARSPESLAFVRPFAEISIQLKSSDHEAAAFAERVNNTDELRALVFDLTQGIGADVVVEATGHNSLLDFAATLVRPEGTVCLKSTSGLPAKDLNTTLHTVNEIRFQGSRCGPFDKAIKFMVEHGLPDKTWITGRYPLSEVQAALKAAESSPKVVIDIAS